MQVPAAAAAPAGNPATDHRPAGSAPVNVAPSIATPMPAEPTVAYRVAVPSPRRPAALPAPDRPSRWIRLDGLAYGGDYNPEQWPESVWAEDVALMNEAGVNLVSLGIFSWALLEPTEGQYDFAWLDRILDLLHAYGIAVDLATPTAAPPAWLAHRYPGSRPVTREGHVLGTGGRGSFCPSSPEYASAAARITEQLARRYAGHPALVLWHVHNEYGAPLGACYCETSAARIPGVAAQQVREPGRPECRVGNILLGPALRRLGRDRTAPVGGDRDQPGAAAGLPPILLRRAAGLLPPRAGHRPRAVPRHPGDDQLHGCQLQEHRLLAVGAGSRHCLQRSLPQGRAGGQPHRPGHDRRSDPVAGRR